MPKLFLSAAAHALTTSGHAVLVISTTDELGAPVLNVKKTWISASHLAIRTAGYEFPKLLIDQFSDEKNGFYSMRLKPDPQVRFPNILYPGDLLMISVRKMGSGRPGIAAPVLEEGYITIAST